MFRHLRTRIIVSFCLLMVVGGAISTSLVSRNMARSLGSAVDRSGAALGRVLADQLAEPLAYGDRFTLRRILTGATESNEDLVYAFVLSPDGRLVAHSFPAGAFPGDLLTLGEYTSPLTLGTEAGAIRDLPAPIAEGVLGTLHVGMSMSWVSRATADAVGNVLVTTLLAMGVGVLGILFLAHLMTRPIFALREAADRLGRGETDVEAPVVGSDELAALAQTFNRMARQIRQRIRESEALRAYVERVLDQMESSITVVSRDGTIQYANRVAVERHGALEGRRCSSAMDGERPCAECPLEEVLQTGQVVHRTYTSPRGRTYELKWVPIRGRDGGPAVVERALDVTERLEVRERLERAQRLAVAGEIAAGVVHSVNNPLDGVRRAIDLAASRPEDRDRVVRMLELAREGTDRIAEITRTLLGFARGDEAGEPVPVEVDALVSAALDLTRLKAEARHVRIEVETERDVPAVWVDPQRMEEVLVNLLLNAVDACAGGGTITVRCRTWEGGVEISVEDDGPGVEPGMEERIFEPFVTTKDADRGTGLGLPVARRMVEAHGGTLHLDRPAGGGARFVVRLPGRPLEQEVRVG